MIFINKNKFMQKKLYFLDKYEKNRILNLHENRTQKQYLDILNNMDDVLTESKFWGISNDGNVLFTSEKMLVKVGDRMKIMEYNFESLPYILEVARKNYDNMLVEGKITLDSYLKIPETFLMNILESLGVDSKSRKIISEDWYDKFRYSFNLLTENKMFLFENKLNESLWTEVGVICEQGFWDWAKKKAGQVGSAIKQGAKKVYSGLNKAGEWIGKKFSQAIQNTILPVLAKGLIKFLRWIRRFLNGYFGIITEFIASMFPTVVIVKAIWGLIILLDIWEIRTGNYDPKDPDRKDSPYLSLLFDIISFLTTSAVGAASKAAFKSGKTVSKPILKQVAGSLKTLGDSVVNSCKKILDKLFGKESPGFLTTVLDGIQYVLQQLYSTIVKTFNIKTWETAVKQTGKELVTLKGLGKLGVGVALGTTFANFMEEKAFRKGYQGPEIAIAKQSLINMSETPREDGGFPELGFKGPVNNVFDQNLENMMKRVQERYGKKVTGTITPDVSLVLGIEFEPGMIEKALGKERIQNFGLAMMDAENWLRTTFEGAKKNLNKTV